MQIAAITRFKNGYLWRLLEKYKISGTEVARRAGLHPTTFSQYMVFKQVPTMERQVKIAEVFVALGEPFDLSAAWPDGLKALPRSPTVVQIAEVNPRQIAGEFYRRLELNNAPDADTIGHFDPENLPQLLKALTDREKAVIQAYYSADNPTLRQVGEKFRVAPERARQIISKSLRKIRREAGLLRKLKESERVMPNTLRGAYNGRQVAVKLRAYEGPQIGTVEADSEDMQSFVIKMPDEKTLTINKAFCKLLRRDYENKTTAVPVPLPPTGLDQLPDPGCGELPRGNQTPRPPRRLRLMRA